MVELMNTLLTPPLSAPADPDAADLLAEMLAEAGRGPRLHLEGALHSTDGLATARAVPLWTLLEQDGAEFVTYLYEELLGRPPDGPAVAHYEALLTAGAVSKVEIAGNVRYSAEGRRVNRKVTGLLPRYLLRRAYHLPLLGRFARLAVAVVRLPRLAVELQQATRALAECQARLDRLERQAGSGPALNARLQQAEARLGAVEAMQPGSRR